MTRWSVVRPSVSYQKAYRVAAGSHVGGVADAVVDPGGVCARRQYSFGAAPQHVVDVGWHGLVVQALGSSRPVGV